jgi:2-amino-4-hydroxy-6-hydroxymethyldihydropteridine diphosphokinase
MQILRTSNLYMSEPMYVHNQPAFLNAAALVATALTPDGLLAMLKDLEVSAGRDMSAPRWGPRPLDLDVICYGGRRLRSRTLTLPHERWRERPFVTVPVSDLWCSTDTSGAGRYDVRPEVATAIALPPLSPLKHPRP